MATIFELEGAIIDRLREQLSATCDIQRIPVDPTRIGVATTRAQLWIAWRESSFGPPQGKAQNYHHPPALTRSLTFELFLRWQNLPIDGHQQIYSLMEQSLDALSGWMPEAVGDKPGLNKPFYPVGDRFIEFAEGLWLYSQTYRTEGIYSPPKQF